MLEIKGLPQIDYIIGNIHFTNELIHDNVKNYQKQNIWRMYRNDAELMSHKMKLLEETIDD